ncbi:single-stranded DNA-binding protein [Candidatus Parcubacteria bacterium]|nr:MAG: single-stranded DNA-binding protein [Candidatus Parcubacteria bacterium]
MDLNKAMIIGRLTRDPETRTTPSGQSVASFGMATNRVWTDSSGQKQEKVEYHNIVAWGKLAEICSQYLKKGRKVYVEGRLQTRDWEAQDGTKRNRTEIVAENMIMLESKGNTVLPAKSQSQDLPTVEIEEESSEIKVEDIPF